MANRIKPRQNRRISAFTLIEIIVTMVILAIVALIAVPMMSSAADMQVRGAANRLAADLEYARNLAITHQKPFTVVFDAGTTQNGYTVRDATGTIPHPVSRQPFVVTFADQRGLSRVRIPSNGITLDPDSTPEAITFDYLGTPYGGDVADAGSTLNEMKITLAADGFELQVHVEPMTGYVTIASP